MGPQEEGVTHTATPLEANGLGIPRVSEEALVAVGQSQTKNLREKQSWLEEEIPLTGVTRTREELSPATRTGGGGQSTDMNEVPEPQTTDKNDQAGYSRDATAMATAFEPLNRSLETILTRLFRRNEHSEKSKRTKKPRCYNDDSDGPVATWIKIMKLPFEEDLTERQASSTLSSNLKGTALNCGMAKKQYQMNTFEKNFEILLNHFGSRLQGRQMMMSFENRRQHEDETIDKFLDD